jgi:two-component system response regulator QseB
MAVKADQVLTVRQLLEVLGSLGISHPGLEARLRSVLCRQGARYSVGQVVFDTTTREVSVHGQRLDLTRREAALLEEFLRVPGKVLAKERLEDRLYALEDSGSTNALEAAVSRLRRKLASVNAALRIETRWGIGYCLTEVAPDDML